MGRFVNVILITFFIMCTITACRNKEHVEFDSYTFYKPLYDGVELVASTDTLHLSLNKTDNSFESIDPFSDHGIEYVAIYNEASEMVNIYELYSQKLVKTISLAAYSLHRKHTTSVYCKNFDSIFISNNSASLFITDSSGANKSTISFPENPPDSYIADFKNTRPPLVKDSCFYASFAVSGNIRTVSQVRDWQLIWQIDLKNNQQESFYRMPERYMNKFYGYDLMEFNYCLNNRGNFVFSFPADSNLYETDLADINRAIYGRSQFQKGDIEPVDKSKKGDDIYFEYLARDCYGAVFFDPYHKRYLRVFKHKISEKDLAAKRYHREKSIVIFNEDLQIVGESFLPKGLIINSLFFTSDGRMYARTKQRDKTALHFLRLMYKEKAPDSISLAQIKLK